MEVTYNPVFYKIIIYLAPIFLGIFSLAYLSFYKRLDKVLVAIILFGITISILINLKYHFNYLSARFGMPRVPNTYDLTYVLDQVPEKSTICHPSNRYRNVRIYEYTDRYVTKRNFNVIPECQPGNYFLYKKYESLGNFTRHQTKPLTEAFDDFEQKYSLFKETSLYYIYRVED